MMIASYLKVNYLGNIKVQTEGNRQVTSRCCILFAMIIAVGFKVNNEKAVRFREMAGANR